MSEKLREFAEWPQERIADSKEVWTFLMVIYDLAHSFVVLDALHKALAEGYAGHYIVCLSHLTRTIEFLQICRAVAVGFAIMGFIGYLVKLIHIPMYVL